MAVELNNETDKFSYTLGMNISASILQLHNDVVVVADNDTIQAICLYSDTVEQRFTSY